MWGLVLQIPNCTCNWLQNLNIVTNIVLHTISITEFQITQTLQIHQTSCVVMLLKTWGVDNYYVGSTVVNTRMQLHLL